MNSNGTDTVTITRDQLARKLETASPNNEDEREGYALVNVLGRDAFEQERIAGSINIPADRLDDFDARFDKGKEIIVYCASPSCDASERAASGLASRGFRRVVDYAEGLSDWKAGGEAITGGASAR